FAVAPSLLSADVAHATATLTIDPHHERAADAAITALLRWKAAHPSGTAPEAPSPLKNEAGQMGLEFVALDATMGEFHRAAYFDGAHACFGLVFDGRVPLDTADVTSLIAGFVTAP